MPSTKEKLHIAGAEVLVRSLVKKDIKHIKDYMNALNKILKNPSDRVKLRVCECCIN